MPAKSSSKGRKIGRNKKKMDRYKLEKIYEKNKLKKTERRQKKLEKRKLKHEQKNL